MLHGLLPTPEVAGLLAQVLLTSARRATRVDAQGRLVLLEHQDRSRWDRALIDEALALVRSACAAGPGPYALQAAVAAVHADAATYAETDWREIVALYTLLDRLRPSAVVRLNRAAAVGMASGPAAGLAALAPLGDEPALAAYGYLPAARAAFLVQLGRHEEARAAYGEALLLTENAVERRWLAERLDALATS
jgi:RNA polymerase sigma-70 factor (ECF subfamily)